MSASVRTFTAEVAWPARLGLGEGPLWDTTTDTLLFVDILGGVVLRFDPAQGEVTTRIEFSGVVSCVVVDIDGALMVAEDRRLVRCSPTGTRREIFATIGGPGGTRLNDGAVDRMGRLVIGTMDLQAASPVGAVYRIDVDGAVTRLLEGITLSNGMDWSPDGRRWYYTDSPTRRIDVFDVDEHGDPVNRRGFVQLEPGPFGPDGITCDTDGCVWVACWGDNSVRCYSPDGVLVARVDVPASAVTSVTFGGPNLDRLFITTAAPSSSTPVHDDGSGALFVADVGAQGRPPTPFGTRTRIGRSE